MPIIRYTKDSNSRYAYLNIFPDQFKTETQKQDDAYVKNTMDYFSTRAYAEYNKNRDTFVKNYKMLKGFLVPEDFYQEPEVRSFVETLEHGVDLPSYVKMYSVISTPVNELIGEISKRPDTAKVKAFDDESKAEELQYKTDMLQQYILSKAKEDIIAQAQAKGETIDEQQLEQMSLEQVKQEMDAYTSVAEKWANRMLTCQKADFNLKEKSEDSFRDLLTVAREFYHIYEDNSKVGYNIEVENPKNVWHMIPPDKKWISDPTGRNQGAYAAGTVHVMELSEIIETVPDLTLEEIDHLRSSLQDFGLINARESNLGNPNVTPGQESIIYDTYDPFALQTRMMIEGEMRANDELKDFLGITSSVSAFGYKYVVVRAYWCSKKKIGKLTYLDEMQNPQTMLVDETYVSGTIPTQLSLEWGWINQWWQGIKIGPDVYHMKPFKLLPYCPIIGTLFEVKNTELASLVDMMKPFQVIYNVCMNQLYELLKKEIGRVHLTSIRHIPIPKDGDAQDAIAIWEAEARNKGIVFVDDSPENLKGPSSFNQFTVLDLTRTQEIQSRYTLAQQIKAECWELVGLSKQRLGSVSASESATGTNTAIQQSYSQTEPLFVAHEYVLNQLYQAIIDASQYIESAKPESTLSYVTSEGEAAFITVNGQDLKLRDLKVFVTNRPEDTQMFNELRLLAQPLMQNGGSLYDVIELYSTKSIREMKKTFKDLRDQQMDIQQRTMDQKDQELKQQQQQVQAQIQAAAEQRDKEIVNENYQKELDRINKKEVAMISAMSKQNAMTDSDTNGVPDVLEIEKMSMDQQKAAREYQLKMTDIQSKSAQAMRKMDLEEKKLKVEKDNQANDLQIAKINAQNRNNKKN